jgi:RND superfamily putative drug exporter
LSTSIATAILSSSQEDLQEGELQFGLPAALIILLLVFGAVVAGLVPLLMALVSIVVALGLAALLAQQFELSVYVTNMLTAMGLALEVDYSLFVVSRYREERGRGRSELAAIEASGATASRAVLFSGAVFVIAMFGMLVVPSSVMRSLAAGAVLVGIVSVVAAVTLLPAVLGLLGDRVNALRIPLVGRRSFEASNPEGRFWAAIVRRVLARPGLSLALSAGLLAALALPLFRMDVGTGGVSSLPDRFVSKQGFLALERDFPGTTTNPVEVVVANASGEGVERALSELRDRLAADRRFGEGEFRALGRRRGRAPRRAPARRPLCHGGGRRGAQVARGDCAERLRGPRRRSSADRPRRTSTTSTRSQTRRRG